jgi:hypothetical protein
VSSHAAVLQARARPARSRSPRIAVTAVVVAHGLLFASCTAHIPHFIWGAFQGTLDVAMNTQAIAVERAGRRVLMSGLHGSWSIGSFAGAGIGALAVGVGLGLTPQLLILGAIALLGAGLLTARMLPDAIGRGPSADYPPCSAPRAAFRDCTLVRPSRPCRPAAGPVSYAARP